MPGFLSAGELAQMRADASATLLDETCTLQHPTATVNAIGERVQSYAVLGTAVPCRLRPSGMNPNQAQVAGQAAAVAAWRLTLPAGTTTLQPGDRAIVGGVTYEVVQTWDEETWRTATRVDVVRVET